MAKIIKNTTGSSISVNDVGQIIIPASGQYTIPPQDYPLWAASVLVNSFISAGTLVVNDGYDDLKPNAGLIHIHEESMPRISAYIAAANILVASNSTLTLTASSRLLTVFTGTVAGQIIKLPNASTLNKGHRYEFWMHDTVSAIIQYNDGSVFSGVSADGKNTVTLLDNSTSNGVWLQETNFSGGSEGVDLDTRQFGRQGTISNNTVLLTLNNVVGDTSPDVCAYNFYFRRLSWANSNNAGSFTIRIWKLSASLDLATKTVVYDYVGSGRGGFMDFDVNMPINKGEGFYLEVTMVGSPRPADINVIVSLRQR